MLLYNRKLAELKVLDYFLLDVRISILEYLAFYSGVLEQSATSNKSYKSYPPILHFAVTLQIIDHPCTQLSSYPFLKLLFCFKY